MWVASTSFLRLSRVFANPLDQCPGRPVLASHCRTIPTLTKSRIARSSSKSVRQPFARTNRTLRPGLESASRVNPAMSAASQDEVAVVLVDHGSKRTEANDMLEEFAALYRCVVHIPPAPLGTLDFLATSCICTSGG